MPSSDKHHKHKLALTLEQMLIFMDGGSTEDKTKTIEIGNIASMYLHSLEYKKCLYVDLVNGCNKPFVWGDKHCPITIHCFMENNGRCGIKQETHAFHYASALLLKNGCCKMFQLKNMFKMYQRNCFSMIKW